MLRNIAPLPLYNNAKVTRFKVKNEIKSSAEYYVKAMYYTR